MKLLLTHVPQARRQYYGATALARLHELVDVVLHEGEAPLDLAGLIAMGRGADFMIADRATPVPAEVFAGLPGLRVVMRSAIDIRNIDVGAASAAGVLVTHAEAGFVKSVVEAAPNVVGIKETIDSIGHIREMINVVGAVQPGFQVLAGYDDHLLTTLMLGGAGVISASGNFAPELSIGIYKASTPVRTPLQGAAYTASLGERGQEPDAGQVMAAIDEALDAARSPMSQPA